MNKKNKISPALKWVFSIFVIIGMILSIVFGTIFYLAPTIKNTNPTNDKIIGTTAILKIQKNKYQSNSKTKITPSQISNIVKNYLQQKEDKLTSNFDVRPLSNNRLEVKSLLATNEKKQIQLINSLTKKPNLTITDNNGNPLFYKGKYQIGSLDKLIQDGSQNYNMDLDANPATDIIPQGYADRIQIKLNEYAWDQFTRLAYDYWARGFQTRSQDLNNPQNKIYFWLNLEEFIERAKKFDKENWEKAKQNPVNYAYVNHNPGVMVEKDKKGNILSSLDPILKNSINAQKYLISATSPISLISSQKRDSVLYLINNSPNGYSNKQLTSLINFSHTPFILEKENVYFNNKKSFQFDSISLAILVIFATMSLILILKYRLLGAIATTTMAFLLFVFLSIITSFGVVVNSLVTLGTMFILIVVFALMMKKLQIFNKELNEGSNTNKAIKKATRKTFLSGLDIVAVLILGSISAFYLNINHSSTIGALIGIGALLIAFIVVGLNTLIFKSIIQTDSFDNKKYLLGKINLKQNNFESKINNFFKTKFFIIPIIAILIIGLIVYITYSVKNKHFLAGFNVSQNTLEILNISSTLGWTIFLILLINFSVAIYITFRYSLQATIIFILKHILLSFLTISILLITRIETNYFIYDGLIFVTFINIFDTVINSSRIKSEVKKDTNTKNFIYKPEQVQIFRTLILDTILYQNISALLGITILISSPLLLVNISINAILIFGLSFVFNWYLNLFITPRIWEMLVNKKYKNKQKRIQNNFWQTEKIQEQTFIGINDFSM
ncbi:protein translocase subunit SecDF [Metamycoplasma canadense]|uniref:Protein-export membrane protein n=1 Tax=Metamycoplasma canadense TaxID=29554 RepID=A0A077L4U3_9BACT|nr:peptide transporter [Metamycoplasma canadense]BAP39345.1 protein-export membrane protein [Metamycoplasma canadense]